MCYYTVLINVHVLLLLKCTIYKTFSYFEFVLPSLSDTGPRTNPSQVCIKVSNIELRLSTTFLTGFLSRNNLKTSLKLLKNFCNISNKSGDNPSYKTCNLLITI